MNTLNDIRRALLRYLARRDYTKQELIRRLQAKGYLVRDINTVIAELNLTGLISEQRFSESYIRHRRGKGYGPLRITQELQARGIPPEMIAEVIQITDNTWFIEAQTVWHKHFKGKQPVDYISRAKQMRFLQYRGFTQAQIESVFEDN